MTALIAKLRRRSSVELAMLAAALTMRVCALVLLRVVSFGTLQKWAASASYGAEAKARLPHSRASSRRPLWNSASARRQFSTAEVG